MVANGSGRCPLAVLRCQKPSCHWTATQSIWQCCPTHPPDQLTIDSRFWEAKKWMVYHYKGSILDDFGSLLIRKTLNFFMARGWNSETTIVSHHKRGMLRQTQVLYAVLSDNHPALRETSTMLIFPDVWSWANMKLTGHFESRGQSLTDSKLYIPVYTSYFAHFPKEGNNTRSAVDNSSEIWWLDLGGSESTVGAIEKRKAMINNSLRSPLWNQLFKNPLH